jgi:hypothetical protein
VVGVLALALAATAVASTPGQYRARANAICTVANAKLKRVKTPKSKGDIGPFLKSSLPIFRGQYNELKRLHPPAALKADHGKVLTLEKQQLDGLQVVIDQIDGGADPVKAFGAAEKRLSKVGAAELATWRKLGVKACEAQG